MEYDYEEEQEVNEGICHECGGDATEFKTEQARMRYLNTGKCEKCQGKTIGTIKVYNRVKKFANQLVQMSLQINGHWYNYNNYMTQQQMFEASQKLKTIDVEYNFFKVISEDIGFTRHTFNEHCKKNDLFVYHSFDKMFTHMSWQHKFKA